ncbi:bacterial transferase hexapeptide repeat protein [Necator americanus]|uniref:Dynactin subunit 6 n=1 Tax=Necator americanus TaxID=51031 RepID=W2T8H9_NECAM|nr:bacterial transferase hexapeptide repeat protein [Necator americanus]ETN78188.1 bacterial transferase hexapeptide repeat protein [Necator americanus]
MVEKKLPQGVEIHPTAIVCREATLEGCVSIGAGTVVHPFAIIKATNGPIIIGENNIIEDRSLIENMWSCIFKATTCFRLENDDKLMEIGNQNVIEVGAVVHAPTVGNNNVLHVQCEVSPNSCISNGCSIGVRCKLFAKETLPEQTVIYGKFNERRVANDNPPVPQGQLEVLRRLLPSYHYLQKSKAQA